MRGRGRVRLRSRVAKEEGKKRIKEASILLQRRVLGGAPPSSRVGGPRIYPPDWEAPRRRSFNGFLDGSLDPPRTPGKNSRRASLDSVPAPRNGRSVLVEGVPRGSDSAPAPVRASRAGAPTNPRAMAYQRREGYWLSLRAFKRMQSARERAERLVKAERSELRSLLRRPPVESRVATGALLQAAGVSASKIPYVLAVTSRYHLGQVAVAHQFATSTALEYARIAGVCLRSRLTDQIGALRAPFCIGTDTSTRAGSLGSYIVTFVLDGMPVHRFFAFDRPASSNAADLTDSIVKVVRKLTAVGGEFVGLSTDGPATMVGVRAGVGALLMETAGFVRHDTCEFHASARVIAIFGRIWPAQINVPSVSQFVYLLWYILNDDWTVYRGRIKKFLKESCTADALRLLDRFSGATLAEKRTMARAELRKPEKPNELRWNTLADIILFTPRYMEACQAALNDERHNAGTNAPAGSIASMCAQWVKWSGCKELRALLVVAVEFVKDVWLPADKQIALHDFTFDVPGCFKTFSRPRRVLALLMEIETRLANVESLASFDVVAGDFPADQRPHLVSHYKQLYSLARQAVLRNSGRYLSGVLLFGGLADPSFAMVVFEALAHWKAMPGAPGVRTKAGLRLEAALNDPDTLQPQAEDMLSFLMDATHWPGVRELIAALERDEAEFVSMIVDAPENTFVAFTLRSWRAALSHTQPVEKTFLDWDHQARGDGGTKRKSSEPAGKGASLVTREAKVAVAAVAHQSVDVVLSKSKPNKKQQRVAAKDDVAAAVQLDYLGLTFSRDELRKGRLEAQVAQGHYRQPRDGLSEEVQAIFRTLEQEAEGWVAPRLTFAALLRLGAEIRISLDTVCTADCLKLDKVSKKGHPGATVSCTVCLRAYHIRCMESEGIIAAGLKKTDIVRFQFVCGPCGGNEDSNRLPRQMEGHIQPRHGVVAAALDAAAPAVVPRRAQRKNAKRK
jgi:hypothetical protein